MPARILISWCRPRARTSFIHSLNLGMLKMHWVCMKSAPASIFFLRRRARNSNGSPKGFSAQPMYSGGATSISSPHWNFFSSRMSLYIG